MAYYSVPKQVLQQLNQMDAKTRKGFAQIGSNN